jgi:hypothetical protein
MDWIHLVKDSSCECGNEPPCSVKCGEFLDWLRTYQLLNKDCAPSSYLFVLYEMYKHWSTNAVCQGAKNSCAVYYIWHL